MSRFVHADVKLFSIKVNIICVKSKQTFGTVQKKNKTTNTRIIILQVLALWFNN